MYKKITFKVAKGNIVAGYKGENVSRDEVIRLLDDSSVIELYITKMTAKECLKNAKSVNVKG